MMKSMNSETRLARFKPHLLFCCKITQCGMHVSVWVCEAVKMNEQEWPRVGFAEAGQWVHARYCIMLFLCMLLNETNKP